MNKQTRKELDTIVTILSNQLDRLKDILDDETEKFDNIPENLLYSERAEQMEEDNDNISQCVDDLETIIDTLDEIAKNKH